MNAAQQTKKEGFTLIELLVVIAIIALMLAVLMPALKKAKFIARRVVCMGNIKDQYLSQILYAQDNDGKFAIHNEPQGPQDAQGGIFPLYEYPWPSLFSQVKDYIDDPEIFYCPLLRGFVRERKDIGWFSDVYWIGDSNMTGGWGAGFNSNWKGAGGHRDIRSGYCWLANCKYGTLTNTVLEYTFEFKTRDFNGEKLYINEPTWPKDTTECNSQRAFISHLISKLGNDIADRSHGSPSIASPMKTMILESIQSTENPVGYSDGHIEVHKKSDLLPRAISPFGYMFFY